MPSLTIPIGPRGPIFALAVGISQAKRAVLKPPLPIPVGASALLDTGASSTMVDQSILDRLGIKPHDKCWVMTPSTGAKPVEMLIYDVSVWLIGDGSDRPLESSAGVIGTQLKHQGFEVLVGRDVLADCLVIYNGKSNQCVLAF